MPGGLEQLLTPFFAPAGPKPGLPGAAYTDPGFWQAECDSVFASGWVFAGFAHEFARPGDVRPVEIGGKPVLLVKGADGAIAAFHNVCRHRCLKLVDEPGNAGKLIRCPYHAWAYDLTGALRAFPSFGGPGDGPGDAPVTGFDAADYGLVPVRLHVWHDWIFANLDGTAPAFEDYAGPLIERLGDIDFGGVRPVATLDFGVIETNWKFLMENFIEPYHVQFVHRTTTNQPLEAHATFIDGHCLGSIVDLADEDADAANLAVSSRYLTLFPNFVLGRYYPDQIGVYENVPLGPGRTRQRRVIYTSGGEIADAGRVETLKSLWWDVHKEDHAVCERMQAGRASPVAAAGGVLSPHWEDCVRAFQEQVAEAVTGLGH